MTEDHDHDGTGSQAGPAAPEVPGHGRRRPMPPGRRSAGRAERATAPGPRPRHAPGAERRRWPWVLFIVWSWPWRWPRGSTSTTTPSSPARPSRSSSSSPCRRTRAIPVTHPVLLTDVEIGRVTALSYLFFKLQSDTALEQVDDGHRGHAPLAAERPGRPRDVPGRVGRQGRRPEPPRLHGDRHPVGCGRSSAPSRARRPTRCSTWATSSPPSTAWPRPTADRPDHGAATYHSGQTVTLTVRKGGTGPPVPVSVTLEATGGRRRRPDQTVTLDLGIEPEDQVDFTYPFPVSINVTNIGGPSAGLAMTLGVIDALTSGSLTGGHTVAATGTIDSQGNVGDVGGVAQKTVAVENAGATDLPGARHRSTRRPCPRTGPG